LSGIAVVPPELQRKIIISAEDWDGFPNERRALLQACADVGNVVVLSGDLHCFFAGTPHLESDPSVRVVELTTGSVSSTTWLHGVTQTLVQDPSVPMNAQLLVQNVGLLLGDKMRRPNPHLAYQELARNGFSLIEVTPAAVTMTVYSISTQVVATPPRKLKGALSEYFETERFRTRAGTTDLEREMDGEFRTWNMEAMEYR